MHGINGSTVFGAQILTGDKANGTDMHSANAKASSINRDAAKQSLYSVLYGGGLKSVSKTILLWMREYGEKEAKELARKFLKTFKGNKFGNRLSGGSASDAFNAMTELASADEPRIPMLNTAPSKACWPKYSGRGLSTSILNNMIQGSASSFGFLSCLLVANEWLNIQYELDAWFIGAIHDVCRV